jgi:hypothetical protein
MGLDRGTLARLDRRLLAGLRQDETCRMVRVPVTAAKWSTWKRYCATVGISMGRAIAALIDHELITVLGESRGGGVSVIEEHAQRRLADREEALTKRERELGVAEERMRRWSEHLQERECDVEIRERRVQMMTQLAARPVEARPRTGRNERCPCGSGIKYKNCHGLAGRQQ